jgi:hypothetical protein
MLFDLPLHIGLAIQKPEIIKYMASKNYKTSRNKELKYWQSGNQIQTPSYNKKELLKKIDVLITTFKAPFWVKLYDWVISNKPISTRQLDTINTAFHKLNKHNNGTNS